ncbi:MAG TPA: PilN domain-containing protein [Mycobacteriales bacterium]|nr:PilN domain-containing protein [Mycobacteriales bacterium]
MPNVEGQVTTPVVTGAPVMPRVNLMPPEIAEAARFRRFQLAMGGAVVGAVAIVAVLYMGAHGGVASAQKQLDDAKQQNLALEAQRSQLQSVQDIYTQVAAKQAMLSTAMGDEIRWSTYLNDLSLRIPDHVWLTNMTATQNSGALPTTTTPTATTSSAIGNVTFTGVAFSHDDVATWLETLAKEKGFSNPYFTNSTETTIGPRTVDDFTSSVDLNDAAKSGRYTKPAGS